MFDILWRIWNVMWRIWNVMGAIIGTILIMAFFSFLAFFGLLLVALGWGEGPIWQGKGVPSILIGVMISSISIYVLANFWIIRVFGSLRCQKCHRWLTGRRIVKEITESNITLTTYECHACGWTWKRRIKDYGYPWY